MTMMRLFSAIIVVQLFFSFSITGIAYSIPDDSKEYLSSYQNVAEQSDLENVSSQIQSGLERQTDIPVIELGALVFYSGNILLDLLLNFAYAIPQMIGLLINQIMLFFNVDSQLFALVQLFSSVIITAAYFIGLMQLITNIRSGQVI